MPEDGFGRDKLEMFEWIHDDFPQIRDRVKTIRQLGIVSQDIEPEKILVDRSTSKINYFGTVSGSGGQQLARIRCFRGTISILGGASGLKKAIRLVPISERNPWEALEEVGFRCALSLDIGNQKRSSSQ